MAMLGRGWQSRWDVRSTRPTWGAWLVLLGMCWLVVPGSVGEAQRQGGIPDGFARLLVITEHDAVEVQINGVSYPYEYLLGDMHGVLVPAGQMYHIVVTAEPDKRRTFRFRLENGETRVLMVDIRNMGAAPPTAQPAPRPTTPGEQPTARPSDAAEDTTQGFLSVSSSPRGIVFVDGTNTGERTPARRIPSEPGRREVTVLYDGSGQMSEPKYVLIRPGVNTNVFFRERRAEDEP